MSDQQARAELIECALTDIIAVDDWRDEREREMDADPNQIGIPMSFVGEWVEKKRAILRKLAEEAAEAECAAIRAVVGATGTWELPALVALIETYVQDARDLESERAECARLREALTQAKPRHYPGECDHCGIDELPPETCPMLAFIARLDALLASPVTGHKQERDQ